MRSWPSGGSSLCEEPINRGFWHTHLPLPPDVARDHHVSEVFLCEYRRRERDSYSATASDPKPKRIAERGRSGTGWLMNTKRFSISVLACLASKKITGRTIPTPPETNACCMLFGLVACKPPLAEQESRANSVRREGLSAIL